MLKGWKYKHTAKATREQVRSNIFYVSGQLSENPHLDLICVKNLNLQLSYTFDSVSNFALLQASMDTFSI